MINICTLSDKNYLINGLLLIDSLTKFSTTDINIYYLCMDDDSLNKLNEINNKNVIPISIKELESDKDFETLKKNTDYKPNSHECTYCFALGSFFTEYVIRKYNLADVLYVDSDIIFYDDPNSIIKTIGDKSMGIMLHRHVPIGHHVGGYNVGVVYFKNNEIGYKCLKWWRDCVMDPTNEWFAEYGRVGDQVYLEGFGPIFGEDNVCVIDSEIGHGAPWNFTLYGYDGDYIDWGGKRQKMLFIHFSHFTPNYENNTFKVDREGEWYNPHLRHPRIYEYYNDYFNKLIETKNKYKI